MRELFVEAKISDGLGNQLFQYATARCLSIKNKIPNLLLNVDHFKNNSLNRQFTLKFFNIEGHVITNSFVQKLLRRKSKYNNLISVLPGYKQINDEGFGLQELSKKTGFFTSLEGYWQSEYYFKDIRAVLLKELVPLIIPPLPRWLHNENTVAVHIRRKDYLNEVDIGILKKKYYIDSMNFLRKQVGNPTFVFFSDDIDWCKKEFAEKQYLFCQEKEWGKDYLELFLMSKCRHQIIANSSFSWWSAWLNQHPGKTVVRPEKPFNNMSLMYESYYPDDWIIIKNHDQ